jgi:rhodanese-related sulfurtransferase
MTLSPRLLPALLLAIVAIAVVACGGDEEGGATQAAPTPQAVEHEVPPNEDFADAAQAAVGDVEAGRAALLDVRTDEEVAEGRAAGSEHVPLADIQEGATPSGAPDEKLYVYCRTGRRSAEAIELLRRAGYEDVTNIGGLVDWDHAGGPVER